MEKIHPDNAGLGVHDRSIMACHLSTDGYGQTSKQIHHFSTMAKEIEPLADWLPQGVARTRPRRLPVSTSSQSTPFWRTILRTCSPTLAKPSTLRDARPASARPSGWLRCRSLVLSGGDLRNTILRVGRQGTALTVAEMGVDMSRFPTDRHLTA